MSILEPEEMSALLAEEASLLQRSEKWKRRREKAARKLRKIDRKVRECQERITRLRILQPCREAARKRAEELAKERAQEAAQKRAQRAADKRAQKAAALAGGGRPMPPLQPQPTKSSLVKKGAADSRPRPTRARRVS